MTSITCIRCKHFTLRRSAMARQGFGLCSHRPKWNCVSATYPRRCQLFAENESDITAARRAWLEENNERKFA